MISRRLLLSYLLIAVGIIILHTYISQTLESVCYVNKGFSFGLGQEYSNNLFIGLGFVGITVLSSVAMLLNMHKRSFKIIGLSIVIALAGISNLVDRVAHGGVCDYLNIYGLKVNLNDIVLILSSILISYLIFRKNEV